MSEILSSWKEIAAHFGKGVRSVQRWEQYLGLPIHRPDGGRGQILFAVVSELDHWMRWHQAAQSPSSDGEAPRAGMLLELMEKQSALAEEMGAHIAAGPAHSQEILLLLESHRAISRQMRLHLMATRNNGELHHTIKRHRNPHPGDAGANSTAHAIGGTSTHDMMNFESPPQCRAPEAA